MRPLLRDEIPRGRLVANSVLVEIGSAPVVADRPKTVRGMPGSTADIRRRVKPCTLVVVAHVPQGFAQACWRWGTVWQDNITSVCAAIAITRTRNM